MLLESLNPVISFQKKIYLEFLKKIYKITGKRKLALTNYEVEFKESLPKRNLLTNQGNLFRSIDRADIVLFGDFHTLVNSQNLLIDSIKAYKEKKEGSKPVIALEAFYPKDQKTIDLYLRGEINEKEFLKKTSYYKRWCFPWFHYKKIFDFAKKHNFPIVPVNSPLKKVCLRDEEISKNIFKELKTRKKESKIFCLIGEFHLAERHLHLNLIHRSLDSGGKVEVARVLSNVDEYFFVHKVQKAPFSPVFLWLSENYYCLIDTPPWIKWFTYIQWEEDLEYEKLDLREKEGLKACDYLVFESSFDDVEYIIGDLTKKIASFFHVSISLNSFYRYSLEKIEEDSLLEKNSLLPIEKELMADLLPFKSYYINSRLKTVFYSKLTLGSLLASIGSVLFSIKFKIKKEENSLQVFSREIFRNIFSSLSELVFNPYAHIETQSPQIKDWDFEKEKSKVLTLLQTSKEELSQEEFLKKMREVSKEREVYWSFFSQGFASVLFSKLLSQSDGASLKIQKNILSSLNKKSLTTNLIYLLKSFSH